jgi:CBS domain-containing protein
MNAAQRTLRNLRESADWSGRRRGGVDGGNVGTAAVWLGAAAVAAIILMLPRRAGGLFRGKKVKDVMVRSVTAIDASASLMEAAEKMRDANVGVLPVLENGQVRGVITDRDLVVRAMARGADPRSTRVGECHTSNVVCARPDWSVQEAMDRMAECRVGRLPVVDEEDRPLGIVTLGSLALRSGEEEDTLATAREVSRRSARSA